MIFEQLRDNLGIGEQELSRLIDTSPARYKSYPIQKRSGGQRIIAQPAREVKVLQYYLLENLLHRLPVHEIATAYRAGRSIAHNANLHRRNNCLLKLDFVSFFHSITPNDLNRVFRTSNVELEVGDARTINKILFWSGSKSKTPRFLSIGAPSSPLVSNAVMYDIDVALEEIARNHGVVVSRYADDVTASADDFGPLLAFEREFRRLVRRTRHPKLEFNDEKRGLYSKGERRMVTGLIITPESKVSIGRDRKRKISAMIHQAIIEELSLDQLHELHGLLAFAFSIEKSFVRRMSVKYDRNVLQFVRACIDHAEPELGERE